MRWKHSKKINACEMRFPGHTGRRMAIFMKKARDRSSPRREKNYMPVDLSILNHPHLSWRAKGLLTYLLSKVDSEERITYRSLLDASSDREEEVLETIRELVETGYALPDFLKRIK